MKREKIYMFKDVAIKYDVQTAIVLQHFGYWYKRVVKQDHQYFEGEYWVRMKLERIQSYLPFYTQAQLRCYLRKMVENNLLKASMFNVKKNDHTKWYTLTKKARELMGISTDKIGQPDKKKTTKKSAKKRKKASDSLDKKSTDNLNRLGVEIIKTIYKEEDIIKKYKYIHKGLSKNIYLLSLLSKDTGLPIATVKAQVIKFALFCQSVSQPIHKSDRDVSVHFSRWLKQQKITDVDCQRELDWFMGKFNKISNREFVITDTIRELFAIQLANGFTGKQMAKAIANLYSSSIKNQFHLKHEFKFATPEYLLKDGNLNKYLNVKY